MHLMGISWDSDSRLLLLHGRNRRLDVDPGSGLAPPLVLVLALLRLTVLLLLLMPPLLTLLVSELRLFRYTATLLCLSARSSSCFRSRTS